MRTDTSPFKPLFKFNLDYTTRLLDILFIPIVSLIITLKVMQSFNINFLLIGVSVIYGIKSLLIDRSKFQREDKYNWIDIMVIAVVIVEMLSYWRSTYHNNSLQSLADLLFLAVFYFFIRFNLAHDYQRTAIFIVLVLFGTYLSCNALYYFSLKYRSLSNYGFEDMTSFRHSFYLYQPSKMTAGEWLTTFLALLPFPLILFMKYRTNGRRWLLLIPTIFLLMVLAVSFSRSLYIATLAFFLIGSILFYLYKITPLKKLLLFVLLLIGILAICLIPFTQPVLTTLAVFKTTSQVRSFEGRKELWQKSLQIAKENPILGVGGYNFSMYYLSWRDQDDAGFVMNPFNYFLQLQIEKGVLGLVTHSLSILAFFWISYRKAHLLTKDIFHKSFVILFMVAVASVIVRDLSYSSILNNTGLSLLLWLMYAINSQLPIPREDIPLTREERLSTKAWLYQIPVLLVLLIFIFVSIKEWQHGKAEVALNSFLSSFDQALRSTDDKQYKVAQEHLEKAISLVPNNPIYLAHRGLLEERRLERQFHVGKFLNNNLQFNEEELKSIRAALNIYLQALDINKHDDLLHLNVGWLYLYLNQRENALEHFKRAVTLDDNNALYHVSLGLLYEQAGNKTEAFKEYKKAIGLSPSLLDSKFFSDLRKRAVEDTDKTIAEIIEELEDELKRRNDPLTKGKLGNLYLYNGATEKARTILKEASRELPNLSRVWLNLGFSYDLQRNDAEMQACYEKSAALAPTDILPMIQLGDLYYRRDQIDKAIYHYRQGINNWVNYVPSRVRQAGSIYRTKTALPESIIPNGLVTYCGPQFDLSGICLRLAKLYRSIGEKSLANYYEELGAKSLP
jgi:tetratricopeptide (TPR) repeat protein